MYHVCVYFIYLIAAVGQYQNNYLVSTIIDIYVAKLLYIYGTIFVHVGYCGLFIGTFCIIVCLFLVANSRWWRISAYVFGEYNLCTFWLLLSVNWNVVYIIVLTKYSASTSRYGLQETNTQMIYNIPINTQQ